MLKLLGTSFKKFLHKLKKTPRVLSRRLIQICAMMRVVKSLVLQNWISLLKLPGIALKKLLNKLKKTPRVS